MPGAVIPLFPMHAVVFPRTALPLHIFEERYKEMVGQAIRDRSGFGIVRATDDGIAEEGCAVTVEKVLEMYPDGRMDILARGLRRFEILSVSEDKPYLEAKVEYFDDDDLAPVPELVKRRAVECYLALRALPDSEPAEEANLLDPQVSFQLAQRLPDLDFLGSLLRNRSEASRLGDLAGFLAEYIPRRQEITRMKALAPTNGHGRRPAGV